MSSARAAVLNALRERGGACTVKELADDFLLHANTVREHLDALVDAGLVLRDTTSPQGRGRPALRYRAAQVALDVARDYELLADVLATHIAASPDAEATARAAGATWGERVRATAGADRVPAVHDELQRLGFDPSEPTADGTMVLRACPVLQVALRNPRVVCGVHQGLVEALVRADGHDPSGVEMVPLGAEDGCLLRVPPAAVLPAAAQVAAAQPA